MKDFDFDELDRAVSSVLTKTKNDGDTADTSTTSPPPVEPVTDPIVAADTQQAVVDDLSDQGSDTFAPDAASDDSASATSSDDQASETVVVEDLPEVPMIVTATDEPSTPDSTNDDIASDQPADDVPAPVSSDEERNSSVDEHADETPSQDDASVEAAPSEALKEESSAVDHPAAVSPNTPPKRGRFMDMVHPSAVAASEQKPMPTRSGVTIAPSSDFSAEIPANEEPAAPEAPTELQLTEEVEEPSTSEQIAAESAPATSTDEAITDEPAVETKDISTPFIPDVPVEKRPLNAQASDNASLTTASDTPSETETKAEIVPTGEQDSVQTPREFAPDVMAVEANETVGETSDETSTSNGSTEASAAAVASQPSAIASVSADDKTDQESHPVFDANSYHQPLAGVKPKSSKTLWAMIVVILFLVGAALGVLYFLYGQQ